MSTFPSYSPDLESTYKRYERLLRADFGDGYSQVSGDGIRPYGDEWNLVFAKRKLSVITAIKNFLDALGGQTFDWQSPLDASAKKWKYVDTYQISKQGSDAYTIEFKIVGVTL